MAAKILVVGGGIAGLTAATALAQAGNSVDLIEQNPQLGDLGGVGLTLVGNAMAALAKIGVAQDCVAHGMPADSLTMRRATGEEIIKTPLPRIGGPDWPGATGIRRSILHAILVDAARKAGVSIQCNATVEHWHDTDAGVNVAVTAGGGLRHYDLLVGADGLYSDLRKRLFPDATPQFSGQSIWRAEAPRPQQLETTEIYLGGRHGVVGTCPVSADLCYFYIVQADLARTRRNPVTLHEQMAAELAGYGGLIPELVRTLDRPEKVSFRPLDWIIAPRPWGRGRTILIGDAIHANPPVLAQGAAMAIEDAVVLADEITRADGQIDDALRKFVNRRFDRAAAVVHASCELARAEVEQRHDLDVPAIMQKATMELAKPC